MENTKNKAFLLLHGFLENSDLWSSLSEDLHRDFSDFEILTPNLPGHSINSDSLRDKKSLADIAFTLKQDLQLQHYAELCIIGHSMGGYIALELADFKDLNLNYVVLLNSNFWPDSVQKRLDRDRVIQVIKHNVGLFTRDAFTNLFYDAHLFQEEIALLNGNASKMDAATLIAYTEMLRDRPSYVSLAASINNRLLCIQGEYDRATKSEEMIAHCIENRVKMELVTKTGHMSLLEDYPLTYKQIKKHYHLVK